MRMTLKIYSQWSQPLTLKDGSRHNLVYFVEGVENIPEKPGVYVFARKHGKKVSPIYIGQAQKLRTRIQQQLNSVPLMVGIWNAPNGSRILLYCEAQLKAGQNRKKVLGLIENTLIDHALSEGCELLNKQGTKRPTHSLIFRGNRYSEAVAPRKMFIKSV